MKAQLRFIITICFLLFGIHLASTPCVYADTVTDETEYYTISEDGATFTVNTDAITADSDGVKDITDALYIALEDASITSEASNGRLMTVKVPAGSYKQSWKVHIYSNTTLDLTGVTLTCCMDKNDVKDPKGQTKSSEKFNMILAGNNYEKASTRYLYKGIKNYNTSASCAGYGGFENISIIGGTLIGSDDNTSTLIRIAHATNVNLSGVTLIGGGCTHQIEVCAIDGFTVTGCTFKDHGKEETDTTNTDNQEVIQLDIPCNEDVYPTTYEDGTPMKNVTITNNTFQNVARGVGTHTMLKGAYHENIKINNNTFENVLEECIITLSYDNCEIKDNVITNCGGGILVQNYKSSASSMNSTIFDGTVAYTGEFRYDLHTVISGNQISLRYTPTCATNEGIKVNGYKKNYSETGGDGVTLPAGDYYISGVTVTNNTITTSGRGIHFLDAHDCTVSGNTVIGAGFSSSDTLKNQKDGIFVELYSQNISVQGNSVTGMTRDGLRVSSTASVTDITGNAISNCSGSGVSLYINGSCKQSILNNAISGCSGKGIYLYRSTCSGSISGNTVTSCASGGVIISKSSKANTISYNTVTAFSSNAGIFVYNSSKSGKITNNTIKDNRTGSKQSKLSAIQVSKKSTSGSIYSNKILAGSATYSSKRGIYIYNASTVDGTIRNNTIQKCKYSGIELQTKSKVTKNVNSNSISTVGKYGIRTSESSTIGTSVSSNTIKKAGTYAINIGSISNKLTVSKNKITGSPTIGIYIHPSDTSYKITVKSNSVTGNKKGMGIKAKKAYVVIYSNKLSKVTYGVYTTKTCKGKIYSNTVKKATRSAINNESANVKRSK